MAEGGVTAGEGVETADRIVFLGHSTVLIDVGGVRLLTDPLLRSGVVHLRRQVAPVDARAAAKLDAVLISHLHHDHLDLASLRLIDPSTPLLVPVGAGGWLRRRGFERVSELSVGQAADIGSLSVAAVQARHHGRRVAGPKAETLGYVVSGARNVYFAGDTELFPAMAELPPGLDVALLPVAGWAPTLGPGHMDSSEAARAAAMIAPRVAVPIHWGTLSPIGLARRHRARLGDPPRLFAEHVAQLAPEVQVRVLQPGQEMTL
jgi:L-ascorbate metabolism protein UlaG (beta-lactamase superfamily)